MRFYLYFDNISYLLLKVFNVISDIFFFFSIKVRRVLKRNNKLTKNHDRCFIILNGPSLKQTDITKITNADTITVNFFYKSKDYMTFESDFHVVMDGAFFSPENFDYLQSIIMGKKRTKLFVKSSAFGLFEENDRVFALYSKKVQYGNYLSFDLEKNMTAAINVSITALQIALNFGYKEIYLVGADFSEFIMKNGRVEHFYSEDKTSEEVLRKGDELRWFSLAYFHHYAIRKWADCNGVKIYNASPDSYLDAYEFIDFDSVV